VEFASSAGLASQCTFPSSLDVLNLDIPKYQSLQLEVRNIYAADSRCQSNNMGKKSARHWELLVDINISSIKGFTVKAL